MPILSDPATVYRALPAEERQEFRLPKLLKEHLARAAAQSGQSVTEYITEALAERVTEDLATYLAWNLTIEEQTALIEILARAQPPGERARAAAERADRLFGSAGDIGIPPEGAGPDPADA